MSENLEPEKHFTEINHDSISDDVIINNLTSVISSLLWNRNSFRGAGPCLLAMAKTADQETFLYFAYASNLFSARVLQSCPVALEETTGVLKDYKLMFSGYSDLWKGAKATIVEENGKEVWGVVWKLPLADKCRLDREEPGYCSKQVEVITREGHNLTCSTYIKITCSNFVEELPSAVYKSVIIRGAKDHNLPKSYIEYLEKIKDNGFKGEISIDLDI